MASHSVPPRLRNPNWYAACLLWCTVWAALIGVLFLKGKMNLKQIIGIAMSFGGVVLVSG